jgi:hypothetical protein
MISTAYASFWLCHCTLNKTWGLKPKTVHWLYTGIVRPMLMCMIIIWWQRVYLDTVKDEFGCMQSLDCVSVARSRRMVPMAALEVPLSHTTPLPTSPTWQHRLRPGTELQAHRYRSVV